MQVWNVLHAVCGKYSTQKIAKISPSGHHRTTSLPVSSQLRHVSTIRKKLVKHQFCFTCLHNMANFGPLTAEIGLPVSGTPANFNGFRVLASLLQQCNSPEVNQTLHYLWLSPGLVHYIYIFGDSCPPPLSDGIMPGAKLTVRPSLAFSYICSVTARRSSSGRQQNFAAWYKEWNYWTFAEGTTYIWPGGHHVGHRPTF